MTQNLDISWQNRYKHHELSLQHIHSPKTSSSINALLHIQNFMADFGPTMNSWTGVCKHNHSPEAPFERHHEASGCILYDKSTKYIIKHYIGA